MHVTFVCYLVHNQKASIATSTKRVSIIGLQLPFSFAFIDSGLNIFF